MRNSKQLIIAGSMLLGTVLGFVSIIPAAYAHDGETHEQYSTTTDEVQEAEERVRSQKQEAERKAQEAKNKAVSNRQAKLRDLCEQRKTTSSERLKNIVSRYEKRVTVGQKITDRVVAFAQEKNVAESVYSTQLAAVNSAKTNLETVHEATAALPIELDCSDELPQGNISAFKEALHKEIDAFKAYRTAIKDLIVAVKTALGDS